jgi:hypothetical protein
LAKIIQMPGPYQRRLMTMRYGVRSLGDATTDPNATPWYSNPFVIMGTMLFAGLYLGGIGHRETVAAGRRVRRARRQAKSTFHSVDWGTIGAIVAASAITGTVTYLMGEKASLNA